jgi:hypothetical protein
MPTDCEGFFRRDFLQIGTAGMLGLTLPGVLKAESKAPAKSRAKSVILVWLAGGPATIDMWDNKPDAPEGIRGEFKDVATRIPGVAFSEHLGKMAGVADKISVVRSLYHTIPSHGPATMFMTTGNKPIASLQYPAMGSLCAKLLASEPGVPPYCNFVDLRGGQGGGAGFLGTGYNPFQIEANGGGRGKGEAFKVRGITLPNGFSLTELDQRDKLLATFDEKFRQIDKQNELVDGLDTFHKQALEILRSDKTKKAFDLSNESDATKELYGTTPFGASALAARRLVEAGVRFVTIGMGGWDTHSNNFKSLKETRLPPLDQTLSGLIRDLDQRGLLESTIVMCAGEFARTPKVNKNAGRDHWARSMACVLAGGGLKKGFCHGSTDAQGMAPNVDPCTPDDIAATIFHQLGIPHTTELQSPTGRPIQLFREGKVIEKLIA